MSNNRPDLGFGDELDQFDPATWNDRKPKEPASQKAVTRQVAEAVGFRSREPMPAALPLAKVDRRRRTGRNAQFNLKATPETIEAFCQIADEQRWGLGETLEKAVLLLRREYPAK